MRCADKYTVEGPILLPVRVTCPVEAYDPDFWVEATEEHPGVHAVEGPLEHVVKFCERLGRYEGVLHVFVEPNFSLDLSNEGGPWRLRLATGEDRELARLCAQQGEALAVSDFRVKSDTACHFSSKGGERILTVRLTAKCDHDLNQWKPKACGHVFCPLCDGFVHPATRVALQGPGPIIKCNRKPKKDYKYFFRETFSGSENLTRACIYRFGAKRVEDN